MYQNLRAEIARKNITNGEIADKINIDRASFSQKLNGKRDWRCGEMFDIWKLLGRPCHIEELFSKE